MKQRDIFIAFFRSSILGYGGGPSSIPLVHDEVVKKYKWMSDEEFSDVLALGNTLPGPINTKMAGYIGYRIGGVFGMINAVIATSVPTVILMILFLNLLYAYKDQPWVKGLSNAVLPVVGVMMLTLTWSFWKKSKESLGLLGGGFLIIASFIATELLHIHPAIVIVILLIAAFTKKDRKKEGEEKERSR
ncbi:chromate transporter [Priestia endophytica]|uniref:chromate transporter n=1 Tax=Priestia endophytica TaxID=135735 RepID=UPI00124D24E2|nr:chromate transporter [Priestia endophytica]KAB2490547.1 chromate transporter [Priestia endophytica]